MVHIYAIAIGLIVNLLLTGLAFRGIYHLCVILDLQRAKIGTLQGELGELQAEHSALAIQVGALLIQVRDLTLDSGPISGNY